MKLETMKRWALLAVVVMAVTAGCSDGNNDTDTETETLLTQPPVQLMAETPQDQVPVGMFVGRSYDYAYTVVDTMQTGTYDSDGNVLEAGGHDFLGQDGQYTGIQSRYVDNGDGTVTDLNTGLMWQAATEDRTYSHDDGAAYAESLSLGDYDDWRLPTIKELASIASYSETGIGGLYLNESYFNGCLDGVGRSRYWSDSTYLEGGLLEENLQGVFGMDFSDGTIGAYTTAYYFDGRSYEGQVDTCYVRAVRSVDRDHFYGENHFVSNGDGTVTDLNTGLTWQSVSDGISRDWQEALTYAEDLGLAGYSDWRLPNAKELQSIVAYHKEDYPAVEQDFFTLSDPEGWYYTSTTVMGNTAQAYALSFSKAMGSGDGVNYYDTYGAGALEAIWKSMEDHMTTKATLGFEPPETEKTYVLCVRDNIQTTAANVTDVNRAVETGSLPLAEEIGENEQVSAITPVASAPPAADETATKVEEGPQGPPEDEEAGPAEDPAPTDDGPGDDESAEDSQPAGPPETGTEGTMPAEGGPGGQRGMDMDFSDLLSTYVTSGVLTDDEAQTLADYLSETRPEPGVDPLEGAVEAGIITQVQADAIELPMMQQPG